MSAASLTQTNPFKLYPGAELCIQYLPLEPAKQGMVRECIFRYSTPRTFCDALKWIVFRVTELFKGRNSKWEATKKMIYDHAMQVAIILEEDLFQANPQSSLEKLIKADVETACSEFADRFLNTCLRAQNKRIPLSDMRQTLRPEDIFDFIDRTKIKIDGMRARSLNPSG
jgi:hypothetical protein